MKPYYLALFMFIFSVPSAYALSVQPDLFIDQAWVQEGPPNARVLAGFMLIKNNSAQTINITAAHSTQFKKIEFHRTVHVDGMAKMEPQKNLTILPGKTLKLEHGSFHLMLIEPVNKLKAGDHVEINMTLSNKTVVPVSLTVRTPDQNQSQHQHHHH